MNTTIRIFLMLCALLFGAEANAQTEAEIKAIINLKAQKLNFKSTGSRLENFSFSENSKVYFIPFSNNANVYYKIGAAEAYGVYGEIFNLYYDLLYGVEVKTKDGYIVRKNERLFIGAPVSDEFPTSQKKGRGQHFEGGSIYWSQPTGAHEVHGNIRDKWKTMGWENSFLGFPVTDETATPDGYGRFNFFEGGAIYYHPHLGTFAVPKMIAEVWKKQGWEKGKLGYPTSDEIIKNNNSVQYFEFGAVISTKAGAYQTIYNSSRNTRGLYNKWRETGGVDSYLGDLVTPNRGYPKIRISQFAEFQKGFIYESVVKQANSSFDKEDAFVILKGPIFDYYASKKWEQGYLGLPISDEYKSGDGVAQNFQGGIVYYSKSQGAYEKK